MGELGYGGSAIGRSFSNNNYFGLGLYVSSDNGDSWELYTYSLTNNTTVQKDINANLDIKSLPYIDPFQLTGKVLIHNNAGVSEIFITTELYGIWKSVNNGDTFTLFGETLFSQIQIQNRDYPRNSDIVIDSLGTIFLWLGPTDQNNGGFFRSVNRGGSFQDITPNSYPRVQFNARTVMAYAPSKPNRLYSYTYNGENENPLFYQIEIDTTQMLTISNRSANIVDFSDDSRGSWTVQFNTQQGYNMTIWVHPQDENLVIIGATNLIRSRDGFQTPVTANELDSWIGGYDNPSNPFGDTQHPDQHVTIHDPVNPDILWVGHDGGISKTSNIRQDTISWISLNNDYNVTQYYTVALGKSASSNVIAGGTQDNGTSYLEQVISNTLLPSLGDISSGDGSFCYIGDSIIYASAQNGAITVGLGPVFNNNYLAYLEPNVQTLFIHPFAIDPTDEGTIYVPDRESGLILRNTMIDEAFRAKDKSIADNSWEQLRLDRNRQITSVKVTNHAPSHRLYFGGTYRNNERAYIGYADSANSQGQVEFNYFDIPEVPNSAFLSDIAINPFNGTEIMLVYSNYNIPGIFHSTNGGQNFVNVEGNLGSNDDRRQEGLTGPSIRAAEIVMSPDSTVKYMVATSIGVFSTSALNGTNTVWNLETTLLNNIVVEDLDSRWSDGKIVAGTHGRGLFVGELTGVNRAPQASDQSFRINENAAVGTVIGLLEATDPDQDQLRYSITTGNIDETFAIDSFGSLTVAADSLLDYETDSLRNLVIEISDSLLSVTINVSVEIQNVNEAPVLGSFDFAVEENQVEGFEIGFVKATDPEGDDVEFSIVNGNEQGAFILGNLTGLLSVNNTEALDFEVKESFMLSIEASDGSLSGTGTINVEILDLDDVLGVGHAETLMVYPNPAAEQVYIKTGLIDEMRVILMDHTGRIYFQKDYIGDAVLDINELEEGLYLLNIQTEKTTVTKKLLIRH
jgi:hypothetical protein